MPSAVPAGDASTEHKRGAGAVLAGDAAGANGKRECHQGWCRHLAPHSRRRTSLYGWTFLLRTNHNKGLWLVLIKNFYIYIRKYSRHSHYSSVVITEVGYVTFRL